MKKNNSGLNKKQKLYAMIAALAAIVAIVVMITLFIKTKEDDTDIEVNENFEFLVEKESSLLENYSINATQQGLQDDFMAKYEKGNYDISNPLVVVNPFNASPQTALILFKTSKSEKVTMTLKGKHNDDWTRTFEASKDHYIPVFGLYGNYTNQVVLKTESGKQATIEIKIEDSVDPNAKVDVTANNLGNQNGQVYFATSSLGVGSLAYDNYGEVRWYSSMGYTKGMTLLQNGNLLLSNVNIGPDVTSTSGVVEIDLFGRVVNEYEIEGGYHHDAYELESGNLLILTTKMGTESFADDVIELDRESGQVVKEWNLRDIVTKVDPNFLTENDIAWGWLNSVTFDKSKNAIILSVRNQNSVVSIDYNSGEINWILGDKKYWTNKFDKYLIKGTGSDFIYPSGQHSVNITSDGKLSIFNNGYNANNEVPTPCNKFTNNASYAMVYNLNLDNMTASVDYKFGGKEYFSYALSSYTYTSNNHKIFNSGWHFTDKVEYDNPLCDQFTNDQYDSYIIEFDENNNIVLNMHIDESKFEVLKSDIYNLAENSVKPKKSGDVKNYTFPKGRYLSTFPVDVPEELTEEEALQFEQNDPLLISYIIHDNRFRLSGAVPTEMDMKIIFISPSGKAYRYTLKEKGQEIKQFIILDKLPKGRYYVYASMNDFVYNTTQYIEMK